MLLLFRLFFEILIEGTYVSIDFKNPVATLNQFLIKHTMNAIKYEWRKQTQHVFIIWRLFYHLNLDAYSMGIHI